MISTELPPFIDTDDTPVWMLFLNAETGKYEPVLVAWYNFDSYKEEGFLTLKSFGTKSEAEKYLKDFWDSYWRLKN
ncbi:MAG: hypothetical protein GF334_02985 [Candidatus Altiarchaeales archaeon]|nr:hypothetical protein [Candidatus Altiarchaeales archaeon]